LIIDVGGRERSERRGQKNTPGEKETYPKSTHKRNGEDTSETEKRLAHERKRVERRRDRKHIESRITIICEQGHEKINGMVTSCGAAHDDQ